MKLILPISIIFLLVAILVAPSLGAMGNIHYVEEAAPNKTYKGDPTGEWTREIVEKDGYSIVVKYPADHQRDDYPSNEHAKFSVRSNSRTEYKYRIIFIDITDGSKSYLEKIKYDFHTRTKGYQDPSEIIGKTYSDAGLYGSFSLYTSIPKGVKKIFYNFEVEVTMPDGTVERTSKSIPLKQSKYRRPWHDGLRP